MDIRLDRSKITSTPALSGWFHRYTKDLKATNAWREKKRLYKIIPTTQYIMVHIQGYIWFLLLLKFLLMFLQPVLGREFTLISSFVIIVWECKDTKPRQYSWRLNNFLLEVKEIKKDMSNKRVWVGFLL